MKKMISMRLDDVTNTRLEQMAETCNMSKTQLIEELVNACFDSQRKKWATSEFDRFCRRMQERLGFANMPSKAFLDGVTKKYL